MQKRRSSVFAAFFVLCNLCSFSQNIPSKFWREFGSGKPSSVELLAPCGAVWKVEVRKRDHEAWLQNGWEEFAEHYSLSYGHFVVFRHEGDGKFHTLIFDMTATEIDYPIVGPNGESSNLREGDKDEGGDNDSPVEILDSPESPSRKRRDKDESGEDDNSVEILDSSESPCRKRREISPLPCPKPSKSLRTNSTSEKAGG